MVARLVLDLLWRNRWNYIVVAGILLPVWPLFGIVSRPNPLPIGIPAISLVATAMLGPVLVLVAMAGRELRHLPVTKRDLWRTTWVAATVVSAGVLALTKAISAPLVAAFGGSPQISGELILLSAVYDFSWAGVLLALSPLLGYASHVVAGRKAIEVWLFAGGTVASVTAWFVLPILVSDALPIRFAEFTPAAIGALIACLAIALGALAWTPQRGVLAGERAWARRAAASPGVPTQTRQVDRLTGVSRVVVPYLLTMAALVVGTGVVLAVYGVITGYGLWWFVPPVPEVFDRADTGYRGLTYFVLLPCSVVTMMGIWTPWVRLLKVLPASVRQINALLLVTPFAIWAVLWSIGLAAFSLAYGTPPMLRLDFAFGMAGIGALAQAALLRFQGSTATVWAIAAICGLLPQLLKVGLSGGTVARVVFVLIGATALCIAALVNHRTLTRSTSTSRVYRRPQPPFGMPATPGIR